MKNSNFIIFFSLVITIYGLINFYIGRRAWQALPGTGHIRYIFLGVFLFFVLAYPLGRLLERLYYCGITKFIVLIGSFYLGFMIYTFFLTLIFDILRGVNSFFHFFPAFSTKNPQKSAQIVFAGITIFALVIVLIGHLNALHPRIRKLKIEISKSANNLKKLNLVLVSDVHLGTIIRNSRLLKIVDEINRLNPDVVLIPGDLIDEDITPVVEQNMAESLKQIRSKYGVFACTGNHEYFSGVEQTVSYIQQSNITVLQDSVVKIAGVLYLIGRKDLMVEKFSSGRKSLKELVKGLDLNLPVILMDHQPFHLEEAEQNGIDLQLSGHTHHGQIFPFNLITKKVYEKSWGYLKKGETHYYISCGVGTWGPPVRIGNTPEIVLITLLFNKK